MDKNFFMTNENGQVKLDRRAKICNSKFTQKTSTRELSLEITYPQYIISNWRGDRNLVQYFMRLFHWGHIVSNYGFFKGRE